MLRNLRPLEGGRKVRKRAPWVLFWATIAICSFLTGQVLAATFPGGVYSFTTHQAGDIIQPSDVNNPGNEIVAIENSLLNGAAYTFKPSNTATYDLGTPSLSWKDLYTNSFQSVYVSSEVDLIQAQGASTANPATVSLTGSGTDANISFALVGKGTGSILLQPRGLTGFSVSSVASSVDFLTATPAATGNPATVSLTTANSSDTNVNLNLVTSGNGTVQINGVPIVSTVVTKAGSKSGSNYTGITSIANIDGTNLTYTVTVATGHNEICWGAAEMTAAGTPNVTLALTDSVDGVFGVAVSTSFVTSDDEIHDRLRRVRRGWDVAYDHLAGRLERDGRRGGQCDEPGCRELVSVLYL